jgi:hypothetical protein
MNAAALRQVPDNSPSGGGRQPRGLRINPTPGGRPEKTCPCHHNQDKVRTVNSFE